ncbi:hypothetical protein LM602_04135 [Candidatus Acetothermia bacterium]|jgi:hypothetical protein|nr:hypothetical protein [Candidatus Acetothermia bacterium]MCI2431730.1 hypothetical protein [Candidatus Acetothermia bacterium]MCI2436674.1 hypothetical protein [Candidatus Acetothermia bacterium]
MEKSHLMRAVLWSLAGLLFMAMGSIGLAATSGAPETMVFNDFSGELEPFAGPGQTFVVAQAVRVYDPGGDGVPTAIETIALCLAPTSTLSSRYIAGLRLYVDNSFNGVFDRRESTLLGSVVRPSLDDCDNPLVLGRPGNLLISVPDRGAKLFFVVIDLSSEALDGATVAMLFDVTASDGLRGGAAVSSGFSSTQGPPVIGNGLTVRATSGDAETDVVDETVAVTAAPGERVVVQQFVIADPGTDGDTEDDDLPTLVRSISVQAVLEETTINLDPQAGLIQRIRLFRESGRTGPGWQEGDELLGEVLRPNLAVGVTFGSGGRRLVRVGRDGLFGTGGLDRFYVVVDLAPRGFAHAENLLKTRVTVAARDDSSEDGEESSGIETPMPLEANASVNIMTRGGGRPGGAQLLITRSSRDPWKLLVSVAGVPWPGLGDLEAQLTFDPDVLEVVHNTAAAARVRAMNGYGLNSLIVDNLGGELYFVLSLRPGRQPITEGELLEISIRPSDARFCLTAEVEWEAESVRMNDVNDKPLEADLSPATVRLELKAGDVTLDGVLSRRDVREAARLVGKRPADFPAAERERRRLQLMAADVAPPFGEVTATDVRWIQEAAVRQRTLGWSACDRLEEWALAGAGGPAQSLVTVRQKNASIYEFIAHGAGIAETTVELFALSGARILQQSAPRAQVTLDLREHLLPNGVYLYRLTLRGWDGVERRSEVRKLVVLR